LSSFWNLFCGLLEDNEKDWTNSRRTTLFLARASRLGLALDIVRVEASGTESRLSHEVSRRSSTGSAAARAWKESGDGKKAYSVASVTTEEETNVLSRFDDEGVGVGAHRIFFHARRGEEPGRFGEDAAREE
jgi:hypothetical protein